MKIGLYGGAFDPIHRGHLHIAIRTREEYSLDEVWLIPSGHSPHKDITRMCPVQHRLAMARVAAAEYPYLAVSTIEADAQECNYTYRTLEKIHTLRPQDELYFIMGADSLNYFDQWVRPDVVCQYAIVLVAGRGGDREQEMAATIDRIRAQFPADIRIIHGIEEPVASHEIRRALAAGEDVSEMLPPGVGEYIHRHHLYQEADL